MNRNNKEKTKKIMFTEEVDSALNGYAIGISFLCIGIFLLVKPTYFWHEWASYAMGCLMSFIGIAGAGMEFSKSKVFKGMSNVIIGLILFLLWLICYVKINVVWVNSLMFFFLAFGCYGISLGMIQNIYSVIHNSKEKKKESKNLIL